VLKFSLTQFTLVRRPRPHTLLRVPLRCRPLSHARARTRVQQCAARSCFSLFTCLWCCAHSARAAQCVGLRAGWNTSRGLIIDDICVYICRMVSKIRVINHNGSCGMRSNESCCAARRLPRGLARVRHEHLRRHRPRAPRYANGYSRGTHGVLYGHSRFAPRVLARVLTSCSRVLPRTPSQRLLKGYSRVLLRTLPTQSGGSSSGRASPQAVPPG
jgi:hypothetical protein